MKSYLHFLVFILLLATACQENGSADQKASGTGSVQRWVTQGDKLALLRSDSIPMKSTSDKAEVVVEIDTARRFQTIDGFGFSLTGGSAYWLYQLTPDNRAAILKELFDASGIGVSYLRISIGASDLDDHVFDYTNQTSGRANDPLASFSLMEDKKHLIPVLKEILAIQPGIRLMGSPWSAPPWMKSNNSFKGGSLKPEYYALYANYLVRYLQAMEQEGIHLDAITIQNEPENPKNNPSMVMTATEQADFVKNHLGPAFVKAGINTKIVVFDHNCDHPEYPIAILNDQEARTYIDGSAFHLYLGEIEALSKVHEAHPDKHVYFTEQWTSPEGTFKGDLLWHTRYLVIGATRNWSRNVLEWNLASDPNYNPHTDEGGCTSCQGALTINGQDISREVSYYIIAHASKFVRPGAVRVFSTIAGDLHNVAFVNTDGSTVLVVVNASGNEQVFTVKSGASFDATIPAESVMTLVW